MKYHPEPAWSTFNTKPMQKFAQEEEELQMKAGGEAMQLKQEEEEPLQGKIIQKKENKTGMPDNLKSGIEKLSGLSMDHVKVHYNSAKPAQVRAHAYTQGSDIHVAPGQEKHLAHEAWHVVQQKQGRVQPTMQANSGLEINDDAGLEKEADVMGAQALQASREDNSGSIGISQQSDNNLIQLHEAGVIQLAIDAIDLQKIRDFKLMPGTDVIVKDAAQTQYSVENIDNVNVVLNESGNQHNEIILNFQANYTLVHVDTPKALIKQADLRDQSTHNQVRNNSQVIDISQHPLAFSHYSYDLLKDGNRSNKRNNDHLTIENALTAFILSGRYDEDYYLKLFIEEKSRKNKAGFNRLLKDKYNVAEMDNINFRPIEGQQTPRAINDLIDPGNILRNDRINRSADVAEKVGVDNELSLLQFVTYVEAALAKNNFPQLLIDQFRQTINDEGVNRMGYPLDQLFMNKSQIKDMVRFAIIMRNKIFTKWMDQELPAPLMGFANNPPYVTLDEISFEELRTVMVNKVNNDTFREVEQVVREEGVWKAKNGDPNYAVVSQFLAENYWAQIKTWILNP